MFAWAARRPDSDPRRDTRLAVVAAIAEVPLDVGGLQPDDPRIRSPTKASPLLCGQAQNASKWYVSSWYTVTSVTLP